VINLISNSQDRFHIPGEKLTSTHVLQHQIPTTDDRPINTRQYRFPQIHKEEINKQVEGDIVRPSQSPYNTPIWINKCWRIVLDFRALNDKTGDVYSLPNIVDILDQLERDFSVCDLASGFHQIKMDPADPLIKPHLQFLSVITNLIGCLSV